MGGCDILLELIRNENLKSLGLVFVRFNKVLF